MAAVGESEPSMEWSNCHHLHHLDGGPRRRGVEASEKLHLSHRATDFPDVVHAVVAVSKCRESVDREIDADQVGALRSRA